MDLLIFAHLFNQNRVDMAFEATKRELGELYTFFRLLADGKVFPGTPNAQRAVSYTHLTLPTIRLV